MQYPLTLKALEQMESSYEEYGGVPDETQTIVGGAAEAIKDLIDRPDSEKDELIATVALMFTKDVVVYKEAPPNIAEYGSNVKTNVEDAVAALADSPYSKSRDLMQVGLAMAIPMKDMVLKMLRQAEVTIDDVAAEDPRLLNQLVKQFDKITEKQKAEAAKFFTGEQPRLEAKVKEVFDELQTATNNLIKHARSAAALAPPKPPIPASPTP